MSATWPEAWPTQGQQAAELASLMRDAARWRAIEPLPVVRHWAPGITTLSALLNLRALGITDAGGVIDQLISEGGAHAE